MSTITALKKRIRSRAHHWYGLDLTVKSNGNILTLCLRQPKTGQTATETVSIDPNDLDDIYGDDQALTEYADRIIERFVYPVRPLQLLSDE
jgi:hypothetical protein